jgi:ABC-2 type transport system ATP-binding protein
VLDEPTIGMDPVAARDFRSLVGELRREGRSLLITTHDMGEAEAVCDRVTLLRGGRVLGTADPRTIGGWISAFERIEAVGVPDDLSERLRALPGVAEVRREGASVVVELGAADSARPVLRLLVDAGVTDLRTTRASLEEVYLRLIGSRGMTV